MYEQAILDFEVQTRPRDVAIIVPTNLPKVVLVLDPARPVNTSPVSRSL